MHAPKTDAHAWPPGRFGPWNDAWLDRPRRSSPRVRLLVPVVLSLLVQLPAAVYWAIRLGTPGTLLTLALAIVGPLALLGARRFPGPTVALVSLAACIDFAVGQVLPSPPYLALAFAIGGAIVRGARLWAWISVGACWALTIVIGILLGLQWHPGRVAATTLLVLLIFGLGEGIRTRREHLLEYRKQALQRRQTAAQVERARIARELHDVLAHSLSQINVQAGVGLHLMDAQPAKAKEALASIKETSKTALDEVRSLLGVLRTEGGDPSAPLVPEPDLSRLEGLVASINTQGVDVTLQNSVRDAPKAVQLAVYRIVQESLTNVVRHARATRATVTVRPEGSGVLVEVADDGVGLPDAPEGGRGLLGMHERAELLGGTLQTGVSDLGGALVTARIPIEERDG